MKKIVWHLVLLISPALYAQQQYHYPETKRVAVTDNYFGTEVTDNYRWLENIKDSSVVKWFRDQADYTNSVLAKIPGQQMLINEFEKLDSVQAIIYGVPK